MAGSFRKIEVAEQPGGAAVAISQFLEATLERHASGIPKNGIPTGEPGSYDKSVLSAATIDQLLSRHSANSLLENLDALELKAEQWGAAIVRLRSAIWSHRSNEAGGLKGNASNISNGTDRRSISAPPCEADDAYWYL